MAWHALGLPGKPKTNTKSVEQRGSGHLFSVIWLFVVIKESWAGRTGIASTRNSRSYSHAQNLCRSVKHRFQRATQWWWHKFMSTGKSFRGTRDKQSCSQSSFPNHTCVKQVKSSQLSPGHVNQTTAKLEFLPVATLSFLFCVPLCGDDLLAWGAAFCPGVGLLVLETTCLAEGAFFFSACFLGFFFFCFLTCLPASSGWPGLDTGRQNQIKQKRTMLHSYL